MTSATFKFELVSPERLLISAEAQQVVVPGAEGEFAVLAGHAPMLATLRPGILDARLAEGGKARRLFVRGGFAEVGSNGLTVLAQQAVDLDEADKGWLEGEIERTEAELAAAASDEERSAAHAALASLRAA